MGERYWLTALLVYAPQHPLGVPAALLGIWALARREWVALAGNAAAAAFFAFALLGLNVPLRAAPVSTGSGKTGELRLMTYNIEHGAGGAARVAAVVRQVEPDLVCLQEASAFGPWRDPVPELKRLLPEWKMARRGELATFSRFPIVARRVHPMPLKTGRVVLETVVGVNGRRLTMLNVHLSTAATPVSLTRRSMPLPDYMRHTAAARAAQVAELLRIAGSASPPLLIAGDFNNPPRGRLYGRMTERFQDSFRAAGWGLGDTYPSGLPVLRIDYMFAGAGIAVERCVVPRVLASDHRPIVAEIGLAERAP